MRNFAIGAVCCGFVLAFAGCRGATNDGIPTLDLEAAIDNPRAFDISEISRGIEYIPLDESVAIDEILMLRGLQPAYGGGFYVLSASATLPVQHFDRTGKLISTIGRIGRGPFETNRILSIATNHKTGDTYIDGAETIVGLDANGRGFARNDSVMTMGMVWHEDRLLVPVTPSLLDADAYVGDRLPVFEMFDRELKRTGSIDGPNTGPFMGFTRGEPMVMSPPVLSHNGKNLLMKQGRGDTLYYYDTGKMIPAYVLKLGRYNPPAELFGLNAIVRKNERYYTVAGVFEGDRYIFTTAYNLYGEPFNRLVLDKRNPSEGFSVTGGPEGKPGFYIGGVAFTPMYIRDNKLVGYMQAIDITDNAAEITDRKLKEIADTVREDSNPVIVMAELER